MTYGRLKTGASAFQVEELPAYEPCGEGPHLWVELEAEGLTTDRCAALLARACGKPVSHIGFAGRKDRHAITRQWFSVEHVSDAPEAFNAPAGTRLALRRASRHSNKLRRGHLRGNRFRLALELDAGAEVEIKADLDRITDEGLLNRFGEQRFGRGQSNLKLARAWSAGEFGTALALLLDPDGGWSPGDPVPQHLGSDFSWRAARALTQRPKDARGALRAAGREFKQLITSAAQASIFNAVIDGRQSERKLYTLAEGDLARVRGRPFRCRAEELEDLNRRAAPGVLEVSTTGPLPGQKVPLPDPEIADREREWSQKSGINWDAFLAGPLASRGERRRLIAAPIEAPRLVSDSNGAWLEVALPRGSYATELLRQIGLEVPSERA